MNKAKLLPHMDEKAADTVDKAQIAELVDALRKQITELQATIKRLVQEREMWFVRATSLEATVERLETEVQRALLERDSDHDVIAVRPVFPAPDRSQ